MAEGDVHFFLFIFFFYYNEIAPREWPIVHLFFNPITFVILLLLNLSLWVSSSLQRSYKSEKIFFFFKWAQDHANATLIKKRKEKKQKDEGQTS